jgi:cytosine/adenosine deaminase-related metal-dependent hydrolase
MDDRLLLKNATMMTFFNDGYNAIKILKADILIADGLIQKIDREIQADCQLIDCTDKLAVPGLINGRSRCLASRVSKGLAEDVKVDLYGNTPFYTRVNPFINIALDILSDEELKAVMAPALYEAVESGTTTLYEHCTGRELPLYLELCEEFGLRTVAAPMLMSQRKLPEADAWGRFNDDGQEGVNEKEAIEWNRSIAKRYSTGRVKAAMGLGPVETVSEKLIEETVKAAMDLNGILMIPLDETRRERDLCRQRYGMTPAELLHKNHALHEKTMLGGLIYTSKDDRKLIHTMSSQGVACIYQALLDGGIPPFIDFLADGINTIIGTGRCSVDMMQQMRISAVSGKLETRKRYQMRAQDAFYAATAGGGHALKMDIGRLEEGCEADILLIDWSDPSYHPLVLPVCELVYNTAASDVTDVIVGGKLIKKNGKVLTVNRKAVTEKAEQAMEKVWQRARDTNVL